MSERRGRPRHNPMDHPVDITQLDPFGLHPLFNINGFLSAINAFSFKEVSVSELWCQSCLSANILGKRKNLRAGARATMCSLGSENVHLTAASIPGGLKVSI